MGRRGAGKAGIGTRVRRTATYRPGWRTDGRSLARPAATTLRYAFSPRANACGFQAGQSAMKTFRTILGQDRMATCRYALKSDPAKTVDAKYLGYWSVKWSSDQASQALAAFQHPPLSDIPIVQAAVAQPFHTSLVLIALHGAVYWAVAAGVPALAGHIDSETYAATFDELKRGRDDCLTELCLPSGENLPAATARQVTRLFERFYGDVLRDLSDAAPQDPAPVDAGISRTTATFVTILEANFKIDFPPDQQIVFGGFIDEAVRKLAAHAHEALDVRS